MVGIFFLEFLMAGLLVPCPTAVRQAGSPTRGAKRPDVRTCFDIRYFFYIFPNFTDCSTTPDLDLESSRFFVWSWIRFLKRSVDLPFIFPADPCLYINGDSLLTCPQKRWSNLIYLKRPKKESAMSTKEHTAEAIQIHFRNEFKHETFYQNRLSSFSFKSPSDLLMLRELMKRRFCRHALTQVWEWDSDR